MLPMPTVWKDHQFFPYTGVCANLDTCVEVANEVAFLDPGIKNGKFYHNEIASISFKLTEAVSIADGVTQYQLNVTVYGNMWKADFDGDDDDDEDDGKLVNSAVTCEESNRTKLPTLDYEHLAQYSNYMTMLGDYDMVVFVLNPGADGDCVQAFGLPFTFKFEHEDCIPFALDVTSEPTLQPTPEPTAQPTTPEPTVQPTTTSAPTIAATEAPLQPTYPHQNVVIVGPYSDETCTLLAPESVTNFPFMGICIDTDACVNVYNNQPFFYEWGLCL